MSATATKSKTVRVDRQALETFMVEVHALACFEMLRFGFEETSHNAVTEHIHGLLGGFEHSEPRFRDVGDDDDGMRLHALAWDRGRALHREILAEMLSEEVAS